MPSLLSSIFGASQVEIPFGSNWLIWMFGWQYFCMEVVGAVAVWWSLQTCSYCSILCTSWEQIITNNQCINLLNGFIETHFKYHESLLIMHPNSPPRFTKLVHVGSSLKIAAWLPLPCDMWHHSFHPDISHPDTANVLPYPDVSQPPFYPADIPLSPNVSQSQFNPADVPPSPDISHPAPIAGWERRTIQFPRTDMSGSSGDAYPDSLARQILAIHRIHFRPQSKR